MIPTGRTALVTGASSGIGKATARALRAEGFTVYAGARRVSEMEDLRALGCQVLSLDVCNDESMTAAVDVALAGGGVDVLVNNAGMGHLAPCEEISMETWRRQFETNVFGLARMTQLVLPGMRSRGRGRVINVSSESGAMTFPLCAAYSGSKRAVEALTDALRFEVRPFGIGVISIQPGAVATPLGDATAHSLRVAEHSPYAGFVNRLGAKMESIYEAGRGVLRPEQVASVIVRAATSARPATRYRVGPSARLFIPLRKLLNDETWDGMLRLMLMGGPEPGAASPRSRAQPV